MLEVEKTPNKPNQRPKKTIVRTWRPVSSCVPVSVERLDKDTDENVDADHVRTGRRVYEQPPGLFTQCEDIDIDFRVSGLLHAVVKQAEKLPCSRTREEDRESPTSTSSSSWLKTKQRLQPIQWRIKSDDSWTGQCRAIRVVRNNSKSAMLRMPSLLESRNGLLHLWTSLEGKRIHPKFSPMAIGCFLNRELRHLKGAT